MHTQAYILENTGYLTFSTMCVFTPDRNDPAGLLYLIDLGINIFRHYLCGGLLNTKNCGTRIYSDIVQRHRLECSLY